MEQQLYKKQGRRYVPIGYSDGFTGFPADGIWLVQQKDGCKSSECILKIDEVESMRPATDLIIEYKNKIIDYMMQSNHSFVQGISMNEFVSNMLKEITRK